MNAESAEYRISITVGKPLPEGGWDDIEGSPFIYAMKGTREDLYKRMPRIGSPWMDGLVMAFEFSRPD